MRKKRIKASAILERYASEHLGACGDYRELIHALVELRENEFSEESFIICTPFEIHAIPDAESPSFVISKGVLAGKHAVADLYFNGEKWEYWCDEDEQLLSWRLANLASVWNALPL